MAGKPEDVRAALLAFDGKHTAPLETFVRHLDVSPGLIDELLDYAATDDDPIPAAATWVLRRIAEAGAMWTAAQRTEFVRCLDHASSWETRLHLLQTIPLLRFTRAQAGKLIPILRTCLEDRRAFVRTWSYQAFAAIGDDHDGFRDDVHEIIAIGERETAASVRARIRHIRAEHDWLSTDSA